MQIVPIFGSRSGPEDGEGLWAVKYELDRKHAFYELFDRLEDPEWMLDFCTQHLEDIQEKFKCRISAPDAAFKLMEEGQMLKAKIVAMARADPAGKGLQQIFQPLNNSESNLLELQLSKGSFKGPSNKYESKIRVYAVRFSERTYAVTGGAIKLTRLMKDRPHTELEYRKMLRVRDWLKDEGLFLPEDLKDVR